MQYPEIDFSDIPPITDFSTGRRNPHAEKIKKEGYSVTIHYSPQEVANSDLDDLKDIVQALVELMSPAETKQLLKHKKEQYDLPCSPFVWESVDL